MVQEKKNQKTVKIRLSGRGRWWKTRRVFSPKWSGRFRIVWSTPRGRSVTAIHEYTILFTRRLELNACGEVKRGPGGGQRRCNAMQLALRGERTRGWFDAYCTADAPVQDEIAWPGSSISCPFRANGAASLSSARPAGYRCAKCLFPRSEPPVRRYAERRVQIDVGYG